jgi:hypothetical protein
MALRAGLDWQGDQVERKVTAAAVAGINITLARCLAVAIPLAPIDLGNLRASGFIRPATPAGLSRIVGSWGFSAAYAVYQELGTRYMEGRFYMRRAADLEYPQLAGRIRAALQ